AWRQAACKLHPGTERRAIIAEKVVLIGEMNRRSASTVAKLQDVVQLLHRLHDPLTSPEGAEDDTRFLGHPPDHMQARSRPGRQLEEAVDLIALLMNIERRTVPLDQVELPQQRCKLTRDVLPLDR